MPDLVITLILSAYGFAAGGYYFTFKYVQSTAQALWKGLADFRGEVKDDLKSLRDNDLAHLEERVKRLEAE